MYRKRFRPRRRLRRYQYRRGINRRRRIYRRKRTQVSRPVGGIPERMWVTLRFQDQEGISGSSLPYANHVWRGNSVYDPDYSNATGNTAAMYSFWATQYNKYSVWKSTIRVRFQAISNVPMWCYVFPYYSSGSTPVNPTLWQNVPGVKKVLLQGNNSGNNTQKTITYTKRTSTITGFSANDTNLAPTIGTNPTVQWFWWVAISSFDETTVPECYVGTELFYYTKFSERKQYTGF